MSSPFFDPEDFEAVVAAARCPFSHTKPAETEAPGPMVDAVLAEIVAQLRAVAAGAPRRVVTLRGLPLGPADYRALREALGTGEARVAVTLGGLVEAQETAYAGVWWVRNTNDAGTVVAEEIEIATAPMILAADPGDMACAAEALAARLGPGASTRPAETDRTDEITPKGSRPRVEEEAA